jgi:hypothetical protein
VIFVDRQRIAPARPALVLVTFGLILSVTLLENQGGHTSAQQGTSTPIAGAPDFDQLVSERPAQIQSGSCDDLGEIIAPLTALESPEGEVQGQGAAIEAERSYTSLPLELQSLVDGQTSVNVLLSPEETDVSIACGEIGGVQGETGSLVIKLSERNGSGFGGIAFLAPGDAGTTGASVFLAGTRTVAETRELVAATPADALELEPLPVPTPTVEPVQVVDVGLLEWLIDLPEEIRAGQINFVVTNEGAEPHSLVIESGGVVIAELPRPINAGEATVLSATLLPGEYVLYCPLEDGAHRGEGMEAALTVVP